MMRDVRGARGVVRYELVQTARHSLELRATAQGAKLFAPRGVGLRAADDFVRQRIDWLLDAQERLAQYRSAREQAHPIEEGAPILVRGQVMRLHLEQDRAAAQGAADGVLTVEAGAGDARENVRALLVEMARRRIQARLEWFIPLVGRAPNRVSIREQRTRWGSCSNLGNLNFNWKLIMAPDGALDYVVVHELCHLYELNHSRRFWSRVADIMPDYADWIRWLKENGHMLGV